MKYRPLFGIQGLLATALLAGLGSGRAYVNIHNAVFPGGEIRGNVVPEPATGVLVLAGLTGLARWRRGRA